MISFSIFDMCAHAHVVIIMHLSKLCPTTHTGGIDFRPLPEGRTLDFHKHFELPGIIESYTAKQVDHTNLMWVASMNSYHIIPVIHAVNYRYYPKLITLQKMKDERHPFLPQGSILRGGGGGGGGGGGSLVPSLLGTRLGGGGDFDTIKRMCACAI